MKRKPISRSSKRTAPKTPVVPSREEALAPVPRPRVESGIQRLDYILKGGFIAGSSYVVVGPPGSGKTILCNQTAFGHIERTGSNVVYMTLLAESHGKMLEHLSTLEFFRPEFVPSRIMYVSGYQSLRTDGLDGLLKIVRQTLRERRPTLFVIDGLDSAAAFATSTHAYKEFLHSLQAFVALVGCTCIMTSHHQDGGAHPENMIVDGVIELTDRLEGSRAVRELTVRKFRGSDSLRGKHEVEIDRRGIVVHPRTEVQFDRPQPHGGGKRTRMKFGPPGIDAMLSGGVLTGSTTAIIGAPGTGKTLLGLHFLVEGARRGQRGMYFGFYEPPPRLIEKAETLGLPLDKFVKNGMIELIWQPPLEHYLDSLAEEILEKIKTTVHPQRRLFVDGIEGFRAATVYPDRMPRFLSAFTNQLRMCDVTTLFTEELGLFNPTIDIPNPEIANVVENVILLRYVELRSQLYRLLSVMKVRESAYDSALREFRISSDGIDVADSFASAEAILSGHAKTKGPFTAPPPSHRSPATKKGKPR